MFQYQFRRSHTAFSGRFPRTSCTSPEKRFACSFETTFATAYTCNTQTSKTLYSFRTNSVKKYIPFREGGPIIRYGQEYVVYPQCFNELMINYMSEKVTGLKGIPKAEAKWSSHFNDTRKKATREQEVRKHYGI